jgi:hypothetical protein
MLYAPTLASYAKRLINTVANSAAAERAFSNMNLQHTKHRNGLTVEQVERLLFIQINRRQMRDSEPQDSDPVAYELALLQAEDEELERIQQRGERLVDYLNNLNFRSIEPVWQESEDPEERSTPKNPLKRALDSPQGVGEAAIQEAQRRCLGVT